MSQNSKRIAAITTVDNPYDPFTQFNEWLLYDKSKGYDSCEKLARISRISDQLSENRNQEAIEEAIDRIIELDFLNIYKKVYKIQEN